ncbi:glycosyl hydrolase [Streptomyces rectiviolaceus]|uniref:Glycosyl hydrolase n=1 Tax=Streptomyces rectiviolaceus TaxID=332591 RepID=A0ABP6MEK4_9ACTN
MKRKLATTLAMAAVILASMAIPSEGAASPSRLGVYVGPGKTAALENSRTWLGRSQVDATDYLDPSENIKWNQYATKYWGDWKKAGADRHFVLGLHMLPKGGNFTDGLDGKYDSQFRDLADLMIKNGLGDSVIRLGYEGNNKNIGPWQGTGDPAAYRAMFRKVVTLMRARTGASFQFDYNMAVGSSGKVTSFETLYPGDAYVDVVGLNIYDVWWQHPDATPPQRWNHTLNTVMGVNDFKAFAAAHNKPKSYPEWGLYQKGDAYTGGGDSPYFIDRMAELVQDSKYQAYFDHDWGGGTLDDFPKGKAQYKLRFGG